MMNAKIFLNRLENDAIVAAIQEAEGKTSGEIRVFITQLKPDDPIAAAQIQFERLGMHKTKDRNGVLIFVAPQVRRFAVIGDAGVHARCGEAFWRHTADEISGHFKRDEFTQGIVHGIRKAGELLAEHFPRQSNDRNELSDEVATD
jgi:uncharacterized membrane protein